MIEGPTEAETGARTDNVATNLKLSLYLQTAIKLKGPLTQFQPAGKTFRRSTPFPAAVKTAKSI